jgi:hypothetical protein
MPKTGNFYHEVRGCNRRIRCPKPPRHKPTRSIGYLFLEEGWWSIRRKTRRLYLPR